MATDNSTSYVFAGLAGDTSPGIEWVEKHMGIKLVVKSGLYRSVFGQGDWEPITQGLPDAPEVRAITIHPHRSEVVYVATQDGPYRSDDHGDHWEKVAVPDHGLPMWSLLFHPADPQIMFAGYESAEIYRSDDAGESWCQLPVSVRFPDVTMPPQGIPAKRVLMMSGSVADRDELYASLEVGGLLRSLDGGGTLAEPQSRSIPHRRYRGHARRAGQPSESGNGHGHLSCRYVSQHRPGRPLAARAHRAAERPRHHLLPLPARGAGRSDQAVAVWRGRF